MDKLRRYLQTMEPEQANHLLAIFLATVLGSAGTTAFLRWVTTAGVEMEWIGRLLVTMGAALVYGATAMLVFYIVSPQSRPSLRRLFTRKD